jgi:hypothetical protein
VKIEPYRQKRARRSDVSRDELSRQFPEGRYGLTVRRYPKESRRGLFLTKPKNKMREDDLTDKSIEKI